MTETIPQILEPEATQTKSGYATYWLHDNSRFKGREGALMLSAQDDTVRFREDDKEIFALSVAHIQKVIITGAMVTILSEGRKYRFIHRRRSFPRSILRFMPLLIALPELLPLSLINVTEYMESVVDSWTSYFKARHVPTIGSYKTHELSTVNLVPGVIYVVLGVLFSFGILDAHNYGTDTFGELFGGIWLIGSLAAIAVGIYALLYNKPLGKPTISNVAVPWARLMGWPIMLCGVLYCVLGVHIIQNPELLPKNPIGGQMVIFFGVLNFIAATGLIFFVRDKGIDTFHYGAAELDT